MNRTTLEQGRRCQWFCFPVWHHGRGRLGRHRGANEDVLKQIDGYLAQAGSSKTKLVCANIWLSTIANAPGMNKVWESWIGRENTPARATVESQLATPAILVEIMVQATLS